MWYRCGYAIGIVLVISIVVRLTEAQQPASRCCLYDNILKGRECDNNGAKGPILLDCEHGKFMLDPSGNPTDAYHVLNDGRLQVNTSKLPLPVNAYCVANLHASGSNDSREIALVCFGDHAETAAILFAVKGTLALISAFCILLTLYVYWIIPDMRETQDKVTCVALTCLMIFMLFLGILQLTQSEIIADTIFCDLFAFIIYFFTIGYFTWLNLMMLNVWKNSVMPRWKIVERHWYILNHVYGWFVPTILTIAVLVTSILEGGFHPGFGEKSCWFKEAKETWVFVYAPISVMLTINIILFAWSAYGIHSHGNDVSPDARKALKYKFSLYFKLFLMAGFTWILEVLSYYYHDGLDLSYWLIADVINALHGALIFCVLVVWRRRVRRELANRRICCIRAPASWAEHSDPEEEQLNDESKHNLNLK